MLWANVIDALRSSLFVLAHWCGGSLGAAILVESVALRIILLPLTLPGTRRRVAREEKLRALAPEFERIKQRHAKDPRAAMIAMQELQTAHGISPFDRRSFLDSFMQLPPFAALNGAIRAAASSGREQFLWIRNLAAPDRGLTLIATVIAVVIGALSASHADQATAAQRLTPLVVTAVVTFMILGHFSSGLALYSIANSLIGGLERAIVLRTKRRVNA